MKKSKVAMVALAVLLATSVGGNVYQYIQIRDMQATITANTVKMEEQLDALQSADKEVKWLTELIEKQAAEMEYPVLYEDADGNIKWATGDGTPHDNSVLEKKLKEQGKEIPPLDFGGTAPTEETPETEPTAPVEKEKPVTPPKTEKPVTPPKTEKPVEPGGIGDWDAVINGTTEGVGEGAGSYDTTDDGSLVDPNAENPFN